MPPQTRFKSNLMSSQHESFHSFPLLPAELQNEIWSWAGSTAISSLNETPEVCITTPLILRPRDGDRHGTPTLPLTVDSAWPAVAHTCRDSRAVLFFSTPGFTLRYHRYTGSPSSQLSDDDDEDEEEDDININRYKSTKTTKKGRILVPYRLFHPLIDTLYWTARQSFAMTEFFLSDPAQKHLARNLRHIAVEIGALYPPSELAELFRRHAIHVETLTVVLPGFVSAGAAAGAASAPSTADAPAAATTRARKKKGKMNAAPAPTPRAGHGEVEVDFAEHARRGRPPTRRCRLRRLDTNNTNNNKIVITRVPFRRGDLPPPSLDEFLDDRKGEMEEHVVNFGVPGPDPPPTSATATTTTWDENTRRFDGIQITAGVFEEWANLTEGTQGSGGWVVEAQSQLRDNDANLNFRYIAPGERRSPLKYRVIEDEQLGGAWLPTGDWR